MGQGTDSCGGYEVGYDFLDEMLSGGYWLQKDGSSIHPSKMTKQHLENAIRLCERRIKTSNFTDDAERWECVREMLERALSSTVVKNTISDKPTTSYNSPQPQRGAKQEYNCKNCNKGFVARIADRNRGWALFCSKTCKASEQEKRTGQFLSYLSKQL